jgi:hypothetical protein
VTHQRSARVILQARRAQGGTEEPLRRD